MEKTIANALLLLLIAVYFASLYKIFEKAGRNKKWEGFVPGYNVFVWIKILNKPWRQQRFNIDAVLVWMHVLS
ncbi:MAG TPA: hypothetical protein PK798_11025, partial [Flavobacteriales bacterium]|nr:hypothetical protein [Flavobacteriales bacterium]